jgi:hypothetical protein
MFSLHAPASSSSKSVPSSPARPGVYASTPTTISTRTKRSSQQFDATHAHDLEPVDGQQHKLTRVDSDEEEAGDATTRLIFSPSQDQMEDEGGPSSSPDTKSKKAELAPDDEGQRDRMHPRVT